MQSLEPTLIIVRRMNERHDLIPIFIKFHLQSGRIARTAAEAVVSLAFKAFPWIKNLFHIT